MSGNSVADETDASVISSAESIGARSDFRTVNGIRLHTVVAGDEDGPLVVLLHGFPECWYTWRRLLEPLVEAGYRILAPDQRGYNLSEKPQSVRAYRQPILSRDIVELVATENRDVAHVVGHDWGGMVAWDLALRHPELVDRLAIVNAPHPTAFRRQLLSNPSQMRRSWYAYSFQLPWLPERICRYDGFRALEAALRGSSEPGTYADEDIEHYRRAWSREGAITGMLNWYRASGRYPADPPREAVDAPTLLAWGTEDTALVTELAIDSYDFCPRDRSRLELFEGTSHWVPHEEPERLTDLLLEHLSA